jgi:signal transduction histidine kinase
VEAANETIRSLNSDLQRRVEEATAELQQRMRDLAQANQEIAALLRDAERHVEQLEELDKLKSRFLSMASHELKTPLTSISGLAQVLMRRTMRRIEAGRPSDDEWESELRAHAERLELLNSQAARLGRLIDELLDVSRIESGKLEFHWEPVDLGQLVQAVAARLQLTTSKHAIEVELGHAPLVVQADRDHLEQVLDNLVSNAIKFSPAGGPIKVRVCKKGRADVQISVSDPGVGIPRDQLDAVFGLFYQAEDPVSRHTGGMGLGLYISKEIIVRHGGRIWAESEPGHGSTFYVSLPPEPAVMTTA